jgi:hypothetical protein
MNTPFYSNECGMGDRNSLITVSSNIPCYLTYNDFTALLNGESGYETFLEFATTAVLTSYYLRFDFKKSKIINEVKYYQSSNAAQGTWQWQGSNDGSNWTNIGSTFTLGGEETQTIKALSANVIGYRYYQIVGVSGNLSNSPYVLEMEFQIDDYFRNGTTIAFDNKKVVKKLNKSLNKAYATHKKRIVKHKRVVRR